MFDNEDIPLTAEGEPVPEEGILETITEEIPARKQEPIEARTSEAEKIYANLLEKTDFERSFIEEMLEFEPTEEEELRIQELKRKRKEVQEMVPLGAAPQTTTILI